MMISILNHLFDSFFDLFFYNSVIKLSISICKHKLIFTNGCLIDILLRKYNMRFLIIIFMIFINHTLQISSSFGNFSCPIFVYNHSEVLALC